jgi:hypothetical protein
MRRLTLPPVVRGRARGAYSSDAGKVRGGWADNALSTASGRLSRKASCTS